jgi:hypothetical protein
MPPSTARLPGSIVVVVSDEDAFQSGRSGAASVLDRLRPALRRADIELTLLDMRSAAASRVDDAVSAALRHPKTSLIT